MLFNILFLLLSFNFYCIALLCRVFSVLHKRDEALAYIFEWRICRCTLVLVVPIGERSLTLRLIFYFLTSNLPRSIVVANDSRH